MSDIKLLNKINELAVEHLPEATAGALKQHLARIDSLEADNERLENTVEADAVQIRQLNGQIKKLKDELYKHDCLFNREAAAKKREQEIEDRERALDSQIAKLKQDEAEKRVGTIERLVDKVFGHPSVTVSNSREIATPVANGDGYGHVEYKTVHESETTIESKS